MRITRQWLVAIEGRESGRIVRLGFVRFWRRTTALRWAMRMNLGGDRLTRYVVVQRAQAR